MKFLIFPTLYLSPSLVRPFDRYVIYPQQHVKDARARKGGAT